MGPDVDDFVVDHKQTFDDFFGVVEVDSVAVGDVDVVFHVGGGLFVVADELALWGLGGGGVFGVVFRTGRSRGLFHFNFLHE